MKLIKNKKLYTQIEMEYGFGFLLELVDLEAIIEHIETISREQNVCKLKAGEIFYARVFDRNIN